jgi:hypothetical protein
MFDINLSPEGVTLHSTIPLLWSKLQESCKTMFTCKWNKSAYLLQIIHKFICYINFIRYQNAILSFSNHLLHGTILFGEM